MLSALQALKEHRYVYFGFQTNENGDTPMMAWSDNLVEWNTIGRIGGIGGLRDGCVKQIGDFYYVIGTNGFYKTTDFVGFQQLTGPDASPYKNLWAPELFKDFQGHWHIVYCAGDASQGILDDYVVDFDPKTDSITSQPQLLTFGPDQIDNSYKIDPDIALIDGVYYLTIGGNYIFSSDDYRGPYYRFPVNFAPAPQKYSNHESGLAGWVEGPYMFTDGDHVRLFADQTMGNGLVFRSATREDIFNWTNVEKTHAPFKMRHGSILVNEEVTAEVDYELANAATFDPQMTIQGLHAKQPVPLTCFMNNSFNYQYEDNQTNQITFVAYNDGSPSFVYIANESTITFNNDLFVIKNVEEDDTGSELYTVTAMQFVNSEIGRVRQRNFRTGTVTYTVNDVLDFFLNDKKANPFGFSYRVFGEFDKQQIENLGGASGKEMISKIIETWPGTIIYPQNKTLNVFAPEIFQKPSQRRIVYKYNSSNMKLVEDSTNIVNQVLCIGGTKEVSSDGGQNGGGNGGGAPAPSAPATNGLLGSPEDFCKSPINATWGVNTDTMKQQFAAKSRRAQTRGVNVDQLYDTVKNAGVSPEWFFAYELCEGLSGGLGWLNHTYTHGDPYQDAQYVCEWIKSTSQSNGLRPAWWAPEGSMPANPSLAAKWDQEFGKGSIGRVYLQGTAAATWDMANANPWPNSYIGHPISQCIQFIRSWGGHNPITPPPAASGGDNTGGEGDSLTEQTVQMVTGEDHTADFQADAKKYLGIPYYWGGHNKENPWAGMDCSGFVSQVYHDFGVEVPPQTDSMLPYFHEIPKDQVKAGDVGFWGSRTHTDHIVLFLDHNTMIYEPRPGQSCMSYPDSPEYHPDWYARNDDIQAKISTKKVENVPQATLNFHDNYSTSDDHSSSSTSTGTVEQYYFQPFLVQDDHSIEVWGLHPGDDIQDDRFKDPDSMRKYAMKQLVTEPVISVEVTMDGNVVPVPGEQAYLTIPERGTLLSESSEGTQNSYTTTVTVVGFTWYPFDPTQGTDITYDNLPASILHAQSIDANLRRVEELANMALDRMPQIFYSNESPQEARNGAIWVKPIISGKPTKPEGGKTSDGKQPDSGAAGGSISGTDHTGQPR